MGNLTLKIKYKGTNINSFDITQGKQIIYIPLNQNITLWPGSFLLHFYQYLHVHDVIISPWLSILRGTYFIQ